MNITKTIATLGSVFCLALAGCGETESDSGSDTTSGQQGTSTGPTWLVADSPAEWEEVGAAKQTAQAGETITLRGRIGGRAQPITSDSPAFVIMDVSIPSCADIEGDNCAQPWDYCCEPSESIVANSATVIVLDEDGNQTGTDLRGAGLEPLDVVIVTGTVDARPNESVLTVRATGVHKVADAG